MTQLYPFVSHKGFSAAHNVGATENSAAAVIPAVRPQRWMQPSAARKAVPTVDANQLTSLSAMIAYIAAESGQSEFRIERSLADRFNIPNAKFLPATQFDGAIRYLVESLPA
jgi:hypothetical protein